MLHSICTHRDRVDSRLFVVGSQTASLTLDPSFAHNLCCRCPNGSCEAIFDIYTSRPFQRYKEHFRERCVSLCCRALKLWESRRTPNSHFWECESHPHTCLKVGLRHRMGLVIQMYKDLGHFGEERTLAKIYRRYFWHNRIEDVKTIVKMCQ